MITLQLITYVKYTYGEAFRGMSMPIPFRIWSPFVNYALLTVWDFLTTINIQLYFWTMEEKYLSTTRVVVLVFKKISWENKTVMQNF